MVLLTANKIKVTVITPEGSELKNPATNYTKIVIGGELIKQFKGALEL